MFLFHPKFEKKIVVSEKNIGYLEFWKIHLGLNAIKLFYL
jgi:hypothetical protein